MSQETWNPYANRQESISGRDIYMGYPFYDPEKPFLVKDLAESWFLDIKDSMRPSTYDRYHSYAKKFIMPYVGEMRVEVFDKTALSAMLALLRAGHSQKEPLSQYTVYFIESMVRAMFRYGAEKGLVPEVYFGKSEYKIQNKRYAMPLSELEMLQLVNVVEQKGLDYQVQILMPLYTGLSLSELCGLKWEDIDLKNRKIHVHRNLVRIQKRAKDKDAQNVGNATSNISNSASNANVVKNGKRKTSTVLAECELPEASCREFVMPEKVHALLSAVEVMKKPTNEAYVAELEKKKSKGNKTSNIFTEVQVLGTDKRTSPPDARSLQYRLKATGEEAGITELKYQALRDTFAMLSLNAGGDAYSVACVMGVGVNVICDRYGPWLMKNDEFMKGIG